MTTTTEISEFVRRTAELIEQVRAGNEVVVTEGSRPIAKLVPAMDQEPALGPTLRLRSLKGHRVLALSIPQAELAEEMFGPR